VLAGVEVREEDVDSSTGLEIVGVVVRIASVVILLLAAWQAYDWFRDPPPGGAGTSVIIGDTVRLIVTAALLYAAANLADVIVKATHEMRASRILLARQTYLMRQMAASAGDMKSGISRAERRGLPPEDPFEG
jgi:hypothetical protein